MSGTPDGIVAGMGWVSDDGTHEGYFAVVFADGVEGRWSSVRGIGVGYADDGSDVLRPGSGVVGWLLRCAHRGQAGWCGSAWTRVGCDVEDLRAGRLCCADDEVFWVLEARPDLEQLVGAEWLAHVAPDEALSNVRAASEAVRGAEQQLERAVVSARLAGASWAALGDAAGMSRQSAHERWSARVPHF